MEEFDVSASGAMDSRASTYVTEFERADDSSFSKTGQQPFIYRPPTPPSRSFCSRFGWPICCVVFTVLLIAAIITTIFAGGHAYADAAIRDADITLKMVIEVSSGTEVYSHIQGSVTNHAVLGATMRASTLAVLYKGSRIGDIAFPEVALTGGGTTNVNISTTLDVVDVDTFSEFAIDTLTLDQVTVTLSGDIDVHSMHLTFSGISMNKDVTLIGLNDFTTPPPKVTSTTVYRGEPQTLYMAVTSEIPNYSSLSLKHAGILSVDCQVEGVTVGTATSKTDVSFNFGTNTIVWDVKLQRTADNSGVIDTVVSNYSSGYVSYITMHGTPTSTPFPLLQKALAQLTIHAALPGLVHNEDKLLQMAYTFLDVSAIFNNANKTLCPDSSFHLWQDVYLTSKNTHNVTMEITASDMSVYWLGDPTSSPPYEGGLMATAHVPHQSVITPPNSLTVFSAKLCFASFTFLSKIIDYCSSVLHVDVTGVVPFNLLFQVKGTITGKLGEFANTKLTYLQNNVLGLLRLKQVG